MAKVTRYAAIGDTVKTADGTGVVIESAAPADGMKVEAHHTKYVVWYGLNQANVGKSNGLVRQTYRHTDVQIVKRRGEEEGGAPS